MQFRNVGNERKQIMKWKPHAFNMVKLQGIDAQYCCNFA